MAAIEAVGLTKEFRVYKSRAGLMGAVHDLFSRQNSLLRAVDHVDLTVAEGEIVGYIGANGSGKQPPSKC